MHIISLVFMILLSLLVIAFTLLNATLIQINYFFGKISLPLPVLLLLTLCIGALLGMLFMSVKFIQCKKSKRERTLKSSA